MLGNHNKVEEEDLPGVGFRFTYEVESGDTFCVIHKSNGQRCLTLFDKEDPDQPKQCIKLSEKEAHIIADMLADRYRES